MSSVFNLLTVFLGLCTAARSENANMTTTAPPPARPVSQFRPGIAVTVGIFTTIFSITFLLLLYVKHCKMRAYSNSTRARLGQLPRDNSGVDRRIIQSLPIFRFSSLRGQKDGLECAVCLNKFEAEEVLRLLPKCKHAFHVECVDTWLEAHSTCPLCRYRVEPEDVLLLDSKALLYNHRDHPAAAPRDGCVGNGKGLEASSGRESGRHSSAGEAGGSLEIIVENPVEGVGPGRASVDGWSYGRQRGGWSGSKRRDFLRCNSMDSWKTRRDTGLLSPSLHGDKHHRVEHRIIISGGEGGGEVEERRRRWSDLEQPDLLYLRSELLIGERGVSGGRSVGRRSVSEIMGVSRSSRREGEGEGIVKRWLAWISQSQPPPSPPPPQKSGSDTADSSSSAID